MENCLNKIIPGKEDELSMVRSIPSLDCLFIINKDKHHWALQPLVMLIKRYNSWQIGVIMQNIQSLVLPMLCSSEMRNTDQG